eukprot:TRINITY_DN2342_c0_g1_i1.p1 TRINITY_DN2342_c0_g1~~TRINITY_DN2342_c0_g1_i1.p1  ORF type:complete len:406 (+),score=101.56 TRINITY_DN2342_c0_g1_i1:124-1341(+)
MCRFILYNGPPILLAKVVTEPEHGMLQQSIKAFCQHTPVNADGFGICWYANDLLIPGVFKDPSPAWNNPNLKQIVRAIQSRSFFAHVRAASAGGVNHPNCHPFTYKNLCFMHNGTVPYFKYIKRDMLSHVSDRAFQLIQGTTDSEIMFAMFVTNFEEIINVSSTEDTYHHKKGDGIDDAYEYARHGVDYTQHMASALRATLRQVHSLALEYEYKTAVQPRPSHHVLSASFGAVDGAAESQPLPETICIGRLNLAVTDGTSTCAARYVTSKPDTAHTLYYSTGTKLAEECKVLRSSRSHSLTQAGICTCQHTPDMKAKPFVAMQRNPSLGSLESLKEPLMVIVSSEPIAANFECDTVPVNHMVVSGPNNFFSIVTCHSEVLTKDSPIAKDSTAVDFVKDTPSVLAL